jgi:SAM-dependent methyltransferase
MHTTRYKMSNQNFTWEDAVTWLKTQPDQLHLIRACYYDDPLIGAAKRFSESEEWLEVNKILANWMPGNVLDLGAGNGISSYAFAQEGCTVTALEPDPSQKVGAGAIRILSGEINDSITVVQAFGETLPFGNNVFDIVYCRQVLHHADNLEQLCREVSRVLRPGGIFIATREHVVSRSEDIEIFLRTHPLHELYGGENAFLVNQYRQAIIKPNLVIKKIYGPYNSVINFFPITRFEFKERLIAVLGKFMGWKFASWLISQETFLNMICQVLTWKDNTPGRLYTFVSIKTIEENH